MHEESTDSQKTIESLVPDGVAALDIPSATISHARSRSAPSSRSSRNADFWSRGLRNLPSTRPPLDD
ncbi:hypothetical protein HF289_10480 [Acidithiobacillus ferrooxidans]|uniref:Uncharacterized protein n=1 Tax=Acidithiobacillus ferridurans TaxID=1232575 RepID=A0A8X8G9R3_ACIFI|nr:hypothetical protein [Acidithiobacillus ferrooxidans]MBU2721870.1 hypothetical protein [Acidithiobacillus ferridurans]MBU2857277.1 hypothetical protein [Acidithiobacillus ferrooxidans]